MEAAPDAPRQEGSLLLQSAALPIILAHESISRQQQLVSTLLLTSKALAEVMSQELVGSVSVAYSATSRTSLSLLPGLSDWLGRLGHLMRDCDVCLSVGAVDSELAERALAFGLHQSAHSSRGLHLLSYEHHGGTASMRHVLQQLPVQHLQHLHLCFDDEATNIGLVVSTLAQLTSLTSLTIRSFSVGDLLPAVSGLTCLSLVKVSTVKDMGALTALPPSLLELHLTCDDEPVGPLQLAHLKQCTALSGSPLPLTSSRDELPPNLQHLVAECRTNDAAEALVPLSSLTSLTLCDPHINSKTQLELLANSLTSLQQLEVYYCEPKMPAGALQQPKVPVSALQLGWGGLPVRSLHIMSPDSHVGDYLTVPAAAVYSLTSLVSSLTELTMRGAEDERLVIEATPRRLAESLKQLTGLEKLTLADLEFEYIIEPDDDASHDENMNHRTLMEAIASLPKLSNLSVSLERDDDLSGAPRHPHAAVALTQPAAGSRLTRLCLADSDVDAFTVVALACSLTNLRHLDLEGSGIDNTPLPAIAANLQQLTALSLGRTSVTDTGVMWLSKLSKLEMLAVPTGVSEQAVQQALRRHSLHVPGVSSGSAAGPPP